MDKQPIHCSIALFSISMKHRLTLVTLGLLCFLQVSSFAGQDLQARLENSLKHARSLTNLEIRMLDISIYSHTSPNAGRTDFSSTNLYTYIASRPKYRATCEVVSAAQTNATRLSEAAFNGASFVTYNADTRMVTRQDRILDSSESELPANPLIAPFLFLSKNSDDCPACLLRFSDIAAPDFAKGLILPEGQRSNGALRISMPGRPIGKKPTLWKIDIDETGDSFTPKAVNIIIYAGGEIAYTLLNYTNLGGYEFPTTVKWISTTYPPTSPPTVRSTGITTVSSVGIPEDIPASTFEIDETPAAVVWDADHKKLTKMAPALVSYGAKWNLRRQIIMAILLLTAISLPILAVKRFLRKSG